MGIKEEGTQKKTIGIKKERGARGMTKVGATGKDIVTINTLLISYHLYLCNLVY